MTKTNIVRIETHKSFGSNELDLIDVIVIDEKQKFTLNKGKDNEINVDGKKHQFFRFKFDTNGIKSATFTKIQNNPNNFGNSGCIVESKKTKRVLSTVDNKLKFIKWQINKIEQKRFDDAFIVAKKKLQEIKRETT
tara:strand:- start:10 stop:417 length:408 start_codon:yes stop_codon:yes gene_type:complete